MHICCQTLICFYRMETSFSPEGVKKRIATPRNIEEQDPNDRRSHMPQWSEMFKYRVNSTALDEVLF